MSETVIKVENLSKRYRLGVIGGKTLREDVQRWWAKLRGHPDPLLKVDALPINKSPVTNNDTSSNKSLLITNNGPQDQDHIWALRDVSFEVNQGEVLGVIGRNGAGKSTLLKILSQITAPTSGKIKIKGRIGSLLEVGTGFHPELTGRENTYLNGAILGMQKQEVNRKFDEIVDFSELERFIDTPVKRYSSGMYVRLAFAVAAHLDPEILLVDEVLAVGDAEFQKKCLGKIGNISKHGKTILFVSHNMAAIRNICSRCIHVSQGKVLQKGEPSNIIEEYISHGEREEAQEIPGVLNFENRKNTCINAPPIIKQLKLQNLSGFNKKTFKMGSPMVISIVVSGMSRYREAIVGITLKTVLNQKVGSINTGMACEFLGEKRYEDEEAILTIPKLYLTPGQYIVEIQVAQKGVEYIDYIEEACRFNVVGDDVYGTGYQVTSYHGMCYFDGKWLIKKFSDN